MMQGNLFSSLYEVREAMFGTNAEVEIANLREEVNASIADQRSSIPLRYLMFKMTNRCNSDCEYCSHAVSNAANECKSDVDFSLIEQAIKDASDLGCQAMAINGGEPLLRDDVLDIVRAATERQVAPVLMTNGILLPKRWRSLGDAGVRYVIISFDSMNPEIYKLQRGQDFEAAIAGIDAAVKMMEEYPGTKVHVSSVLTKDNLDEFTALVKYMSSRGIAVQISPYHHYDKRKKDTVSTHDRASVSSLSSKLLEMKDQGYLIASSRGFINHLPKFFGEGARVPDGYCCKIGYTNLFIDAYGDIRPCWDWCFEPIGNLANMTVKDAWQSSTMDLYRGRMLDCQCDGCWYMCTGEVTMLLDGDL